MNCRPLAAHTLAALAGLALLTTALPSVHAQADGPAAIRQALALRDAGKADEAAFALRKLIRAQPNLGRAHYELALIYLGQNRDALGKASLFRAVALSPEDPDVIPAIARYTPRLAKIELADAYAARDKQEVEDARRGNDAAPAKPAPPVRPAAPTKPQPASPTKTVALPPMTPRAGHIVGRVILPDGSPVPKFFIAYSGFEDGKLATYGAGGIANDTVNATAQGAGGRYAVKVPPGAYRAKGYVTYVFQGRTYHFELEPVNMPKKLDYEGLGLEKLRGGLVRDFVLNMTAKRQGASEATESVYRTAYFGGRVELDCSIYEGILGGGNKLTTPLRNAFPKESLVEITLAPQAMVDGTRGQVITSTFPLGDDGKWTFQLRGVYPGLYTATARLKTPDGGELPLRLTLQRARTLLKGAGDYDRVVADWQTSVPVDFLPNDLGPIPRMGVKAVRLYLGQ